MRRDWGGGERARLRRAAANGNRGAEARIEAAVMTLAWLLGRQIAREHLDRLHAANDDMPKDKAGER